MGVVRLAAERDRDVRAERRASRHRALERARPASRSSRRTWTACTNAPAPRNVIRYHGSIWTLKCSGGCGAARLGRSARPDRSAAAALPVVRRAGASRVWSGSAKPIPPAAARAAQAATACDVFLSIGTSSVVYPAAGLVAAAQARGAFTVEINPESDGRGTWTSRSRRWPRKSCPICRFQIPDFQIQIRGSVTPRCFRYLPFLSAYETSHGSSPWKNSTCASPSLA